VSRRGSIADAEHGLVPTSKEAHCGPERFNSSPRSPASVATRGLNGWTGQVWELIPGEDFRAKVGTFKQMAQTQARKSGGRVQTATEECQRE